MKMIKLHNQTDKDILDYRIDEAELDANGNAKIDDTGNYVRSGNTLEWSVKAGETVAIPEYAAKYLHHIYGFLMPSQDTEGIPPTPPTGGEPTPASGPLTCRGCGKQFEGAKGLALHMAHHHIELL